MSMKLYTIIQVLPTDDYRVYLYFAHGEIRLYDATEILVHGVFRVLKDKKIFAESCTVLNNTLAWDVKGNFDPYECLDLDPGVLYEKPPVSDRLPHTDLEQKSVKLLAVNSLRAVLPLFTLVPIARRKEWFWSRSCAHFGERNSHPAGKIYNALSVTGLAGEFNCLLKFANPKGD